MVYNMNFIREKLYLKAVHTNKKMTIKRVKRFILKYKKSVIHATLLMEYIKVNRIQTLAKVIDPKKKLPADIVFLIIKKTGF